MKKSKSVSPEALEKELFIRTLKANKQISKGKKMKSGETHKIKSKKLVRKRFSAI